MPRSARPSPRRAPAAASSCVEGAPEFYRGGNTRHTRNVRLAHDGTAPTMTGAYAADEFLDDLYRVTGGADRRGAGRADHRALARIAAWMDEQGVRFQPPLGGTLSLGKHQRVFPRRRARRAQRALPHRRAARRHRALRHAGHRARHRERLLHVGDASSTTATRSRVRGRALVAAAGGFEANIEWLKQYWGEAADNFLIRGTPYNRGDVLRMLLDAGRRCRSATRRSATRSRSTRARRNSTAASPRGSTASSSASSSTATASASTTRARTSGRSATRSGAAWSRSSRGRSPMSIIDAKSMRLFMPSVFPADRGAHDRRAGGKLGLDRRARSTKTVAEFNAAVRPGTFDHTKLDDCATEGLDAAEERTGRARSTRRRSTAIRCGPASPSPISASR